MKKTWELLRNLTRDSNLPLAIIGDRKNIVSNIDKKGGASYAHYLVNGFNDTLHDTMLTDMDLVGHQYAWERGRGGDEWVEVRLHRALANSCWLSIFSFTKLYNMNGSPSDRSLLFLDLRKKGEGIGRRHFRFETVWTSEPQCHKVVEDVWESNIEADCYV
ncbi:uncharacterized protein LOC141722515 [Apium graveolens]|uniref:uncharacterized protein LOC141722515 n=1 Tax=Apium graveolens TaxID=4045 RepID=UPI003D78D0B6